MTIREALAQENPSALFYPERFDAALVGRTQGFGAKADSRPVPVYDRQRLIEILAADFAKDTDPGDEDLEERDVLLEAEEWVNINMAGAYLGPNAPVIVIGQESELVLAEAQPDHRTTDNY